MQNTKDEFISLDFTRKPPKTDFGVKGIFIEVFTYIFIHIVQNVSASLYTCQINHVMCFPDFSFIHFPTRLTVKLGAQAGNSKRQTKNPTSPL